MSQLSGWMGYLVDNQHRLRILQLAIFFQKIATASAYAAFTAIFFIDKFLEAGSQGKNAQGPIWALFTVIVLSGIVIKLATVCIQVCDSANRVVLAIDCDEYLRLA